MNASLMRSRGFNLVEVRKSCDFLDLPPLVTRPLLFLSKLNSRFLSERALETRAREKANKLEDAVEPETPLGGGLEAGVCSSVDLEESDLDPP